MEHFAEMISCIFLSNFKSLYLLGPLQEANLQLWTGFTLSQSFFYGKVAVVLEFVCMSFLLLNQVTNFCGEGLMHSFPRSLLIYLKQILLLK
jgi:hypothetical protein